MILFISAAWTRRATTLITSVSKSLRSIVSYRVNMNIDENENKMENYI